MSAKECPGTLCRSSREDPGANTRTWAHALFAAAPSADGLVYRCRHNEGRFAWMLTTDPTHTVHPALTVNSNDSVPLQSTIGLALVERMLAQLQRDPGLDDLINTQRENDNLRKRPEW
ncbi:hypothetical protein I1A62_21275 [Rhodococcus sp. USK10]|uniref:hypothetical protein n=1 Tax=Rhodococcus sp. USK10 TaxID=2789739 RepID=UPI001C5F31C7|nr:hypothetical protein [Rhodococcus sp. USK10]QYB06823.1 hypothetical protein I1A62_21275 [Rhodococcus sp. USK10]